MKRDTWHADADAVPDLDHRKIFFTDFTVRREAKGALRFRIETNRAEKLIQAILGGSVGRNTEGFQGCRGKHRSDARLRKLSTKRRRVIVAMKTDSPFNVSEDDSRVAGVPKIILGRLLGISMIPPKLSRDTPNAPPHISIQFCIAATLTELANEGWLTPQRAVLISVRTIRRLLAQASLAPSSTACIASGQS